MRSASLNVHLPLCDRFDYSALDFHSHKNVANLDEEHSYGLYYSTNCTQMKATVCEDVYDVQFFSVSLQRMKDVSAILQVDCC